MPFEQIKSYVTYVVNKFKRFNPIWIVSGDVGFTDMKGQKKDPADQISIAEVIRTAPEIDPEDLYTFHINGESTEVPDELFKKTDFFFLSIRPWIYWSIYSIYNPTKKCVKITMEAQSLMQNFVMKD